MSNRIYKVVGVIVHRVSVEVEALSPDEALALARLEVGVSEWGDGEEWAAVGVEATPGIDNPTAIGEHIEWQSVGEVA